MSSTSTLITTNLVAWYGAVVATLSVLFSIYNTLRDRAKIKILYDPNQFLHGAVSSYGYDSDKEYLSINVINKGRRPIKIEKAALKILGRKGYLLLSDSFVDHRTRVITEEEPRTLFLLEQDSVDLNKVLTVFIYDGAGREYKKHIKIFPTFLRILDRIKFYGVFAICIGIFIVLLILCKYLIPVWVKQ